MKRKACILILAVLLLLLAACKPTPAETGGVTAEPDAEITSVEAGDEEDSAAQLSSADIVATQRANMGPTPFPLTLINITDGMTLTASIPAPGAMPVTSFQVETDYEDFSTLALEADGQEVFAWQILHNAGRATYDVKWVPWHGNGEYALTLRLLTSAGEIIVEQPLTVTVDGIPAGTPTVKERFIQEYQKAFGLSLTDPVFAHLHDMWVTDESINQWASSVYTDELYYAIKIHDDGRVEKFSGYLAADPGSSSGVCPPQGVYDVLVVIVDYANTGVSRAKILGELEKAANEMNALWAEHSAAMGLAEPIIQIVPTFVYLDAPPNPGSFVTQQQIWERAGVMSTDWDIVAEVDLDAEGSSKPFSAGGMAFPGFCNPTPPADIAMIVWVQDVRNAESKGYSLFGHEFYHVLGWQHEWLSGDGGTMSRQDTWQVFPYRFMGWSDADGDGMVEIFDSTPYGIGAS